MALCSSCSRRKEPIVGRPSCQRQPCLCWVRVCGWTGGSERCFPTLTTLTPFPAVAGTVQQQQTLQFCEESPHRDMKDQAWIQVHCNYLRVPSRALLLGQHPRVLGTQELGALHGKSWWKLPLTSMEADSGHRKLHP